MGCNGSISESRAGGIEKGSTLHKAPNSSRGNDKMAYFPGRRLPNDHNIAASNLAVVFDILAIHVENVADSTPARKLPESRKSHKLRAKLEIQFTALRENE